MTRLLTPFQATFLDYPDPESYAVSICFMGCDNGCPHCQNPEFQNPLYDNLTKEYDVQGLIEELKIFCKRNRTNKVVLSGGDPLSCYNIEFTKELLKLSSDIFDYCIFTGHDKKYCKNNGVKGFKFLKCGYFDYKNKRESLKTDDYIQYASPNQELYDEKYCLLTKNGVYYFNEN